MKTTAIALVPLRKSADITIRKRISGLFLQGRRAVMGEMIIYAVSAAGLVGSDPGEKKKDARFKARKRAVRKKSLWSDPEAVYSAEEEIKHYPTYDRSMVRH